MARMSVKIHETLFRAEAFAGNCLFNNLSRRSSHNQSSLNNQNNNNCQQQQNNVVQAGVARGGNP